MVNLTPGFGGGRAAQKKGIQPKSKNEVIPK